MEQKLKKYCTIISGYAFKSQDLSEGTDIPIIKIGNISNGENIIVDNSTQYVNKEFLSIDKKYHVLKGDILISLTGSHMNQPNSMVGRCCRNLDDVVYLLNQRAGKVIPKKTVNKDFLYYVFRLKSIQYAIANRAYGGANQVNVSPKDIMGIKFRIPNSAVQNRIADILTTYDNLIANNNKRIKLLEQMAENLYKEWFVRFRFPGYENVEFEGKIPKCWNQLSLNQFGIQLESGARPKGGINSSIDDGVPSLGAESVKGLAEFDYSDVKLIPKEFYQKLKRGKNRGNHILIYKDGAYIGKVTIFKYGFPFECFAINEHVFFMNSLRAEYQNYLYFTLKQTSYFTLMQNLNRNAAQPGLSQEDINRIKIIEPDQVTVDSFNDIVEPILKEVFQLAKKNHSLIKQRNSLLPRLMSGKLEV